MKRSSLPNPRMITCGLAAGIKDEARRAMLGRMAAGACGAQGPRDGLPMAALTWGGILGRNTGGL